MSKLKEKTIDMIVSLVNEVDKSGETGKMYKESLTALNDEQFKQYMTSLKEGEDTLYVLLPNLQEAKKRGITFANNLKVAKKHGIEFEQRLNVVDPKTGRRFLTNNKYMVFDLPVRRPIQTIKSGLSIAKDDSRIDPTTGQVVGPSLAASVTRPELLSLHSRGLKKSIIELTKLRGGDNQARRMAYNQIYQTGKANVGSILKEGTKTKSTQVFSVHLKTMMVNNNI